MRGYLGVNVELLRYIGAHHKVLLGVPFKGQCFLSGVWGLEFTSPTCSTCLGLHPALKLSSRSSESLSPKP